MVAPQEVEKKRREKPTTFEQIWGLVQEAVQTKGRGAEGANLDNTLKGYADTALAARRPVRPKNLVPVVVDPETQKRIKPNEEAVGWILAMADTFENAAGNNNPKKIKLDDSAMVG
ncbi:MAG TPA: hypothetical protein VI912_03420 [Candidatus Bilamarchaeaceae archaeon]|nr:hypothetical protein [Candidatus Bilamarchaeaceae archaeon]